MEGSQVRSKCLSERVFCECRPIRKKLFMTVVKDGEVGFVPGEPGRRGRVHDKGVSWGERDWIEVRLQPGQGGYTHMRSFEQVGIYNQGAGWGQQMENLEGNVKDKSFWLKGLARIMAAGGPEWEDIWPRSGVAMNCLRVLSQTGVWEDRGTSQRTQRRLTQVLVKGRESVPPLNKSGEC